MNRMLALSCLLLGSLFSLPVVATDFSELFDRVNDAVVTITITQNAEQLSGAEVVDVSVDGYGAGVIVDKSGLVLTAAHVVNLADKMQVHLNNGQSFDARTISSFPFADLALVRIVNPSAELPVAALGDSDTLAIGEEVIVIGTPSGLSQTLTVGHFSGRPANTGSFNVADTDFLQTDAAIMQGNSGGPMFNTRGEVMGIVSHFRTDTSGFGFIASSNMARDLVLKHGEVWAGISVEPVGDVLAKAINTPFPNAVLIQDIATGSLAEKLGLRPGLIPATINGRSIKLGGDIIISIGGKDVSFNKAGIEGAYAYLSGRKKGESIKMTVFRDGQKVKLSAPKP
ncbi:MAG: trypsin-like serine protease [Proteobacteria bacterium]|nr:trypsin-like serine protease [Pseudomonadota bacterium]